MKRLIYILLLLFFCGCARPQSIRISVSPIAHHLPSDVSPVPLIVIVGESNAGGLAVNADLTAYELAPRSSTKILNNTTLTFQDLDIGTNNLILHQDIPDNATHGMENGLANCADTGLLGAIPIYILKAGTGTAKISWWNDSTFIYGGVNAWQQCKTRMDAAIILLNTINNGVNPPIYLIWSLGINDALAGTNTSTWKDSVKSFFTKFRARYGANIPIIMTLFVGGSYPPYSTKLSEIASEISNCFGVTCPLTTIGGVHWSAAAFKIIASTMVRTIISHYEYRW